MNTTFFNDTLIAFEAQWAFVSNTSDEDYKRLVREHLTIEVFFLYFIFVTGSATNLFLLLHIASQTRQKSGSHVLLINLVIVDLLLIVFKIFPDIIWCQTVSWEVGELACKLVNFIGHFSLYSSCYLVVCISYNRYNLLKEPHIFHKEKQRAYRMLKIAYLFSGFLSLPQFIIYRVIPLPNFNILQCVNNNFLQEEWQWKAFNFYYFFGLYLIPLQLIIILYTKIISSLNLEKYLAVQMAMSTSSEEKLSQKTNYMLKTKRKTIITFLAVTISFAICWTPYSLFGLIHTIWNGSETIVHANVEGFFKMLALFTSTLNPIVHGNHVFSKYLLCKMSKSFSITHVSLKQLGRGRVATGSDLGLIHNYTNNDKVPTMR